ncbi:LytR C-terminal domain-containing protein [Rothia sp. ZJ1223]|uniref:LytR C-terminal domain-containing protein n=1 Tax=Rothia sp. ZJ1223 TaxID=2811098 RepID=UPI00195B3088|nr:LytR C-terminal domain-containing protein [Rothia sp. ZJ1223]MBM7052042.1 LytR C-terminal domain-containing protein [Rothia sp. ZJ1223]
MQQFPRDEFDDVDESSKRRGAYRAQDPLAGASKTLLPLIGAGLASLLLGGFMYIYSPQTSAPGAAKTTEASASASESEIPTAEPTPEDTGEPVILEIYNSGGITGAASDAMNLIMASTQNVTITQVGNWQGTPVNGSIVYYAAGYEDEANEAADTLEIPYIQEDPTQAVPVIAVLGPDYVLSSLRVDSDQMSGE